jgi:hypothetical protein
MLELELERVLVRVGNVDLETADIVGVHVVGVVGDEMHPDEPGPSSRALEQELEIASGIAAASIHEAP